MERVITACTFLKMSGNNSTSGIYPDDLLNAYYKQMQTLPLNSPSTSISESAGLLFLHTKYNSKIFTLLTALEMCQRKITVTHFITSVLVLSHQIEKDTYLVLMAVPFRSEYTHKCPTPCSLLEPLGFALKWYQNCCWHHLSSWFQAWAHTVKKSDHDSRYSCRWWISPIL